MKVKIDFLGGGRLMRIFLAEKGAAGQMSLRNTGLNGTISYLQRDKNTLGSAC